MLGNKDNRPTWLSNTVWFENAKGVGGFGKFDVNNLCQSTNIDRNWQAGLRSSIHYAYKTYRKSSVTFLLTKLGSRAEKNYIASLTVENRYFHRKLLASTKTALQGLFSNIFLRILRETAIMQISIQNILLQKIFWEKLIHTYKLMLTHSFPIHPFSNPWKLWKTVRCVENGCIGNKWIK